MTYLNFQFNLNVRLLTIKGYIFYKWNGFFPLPIFFPTFLMVTTLDYPQHSFLLHLSSTIELLTGVHPPRQEFPDQDCLLPSLPVPPWHSASLLTAPRIRDAGRNLQPHTDSFITRVSCFVFPGCLEWSTRAIRTPWWLLLTKPQVERLMPDETRYGKEEGWVWNL